MGVEKESGGFANALAGGAERDKLEQKAQAVMEDNLDLMREVVMMIREDEDFAKSIYSDCPRLQHLLDQHPDLRPIFEDPNLIRINFESVYRKAGGVLPEDEMKKPPAWKKCVACIVNHPLFKVLRFLLVIKKIFNCIMGGGFAMIRGCFQGCIGGFCMEEALDAVGDHDGPGGDHGPDGADHGPNSQNKAQLNKAADHMAEPEVQEKMHNVLESGDEDQLREAIESDKELKALRESNPLCAELMSDPETMRILVDPDNLRALGECPDLIEADFADPDWVAPDDLEGAADLEADADVEPEAEPESGEVEADEYDEEAGLEEEDEGMGEFEMGDDDKRGGNNARGGNKGGKKGQSGNNQKNGEQQGGMMSRIGAGLTDWVAGEVIGVSAGDFTFGGDDEFADLEGLDDAADGAEAANDAADVTADQMDQMNTAAQSAAATADMLASDGLTDNLDHLDTIEDQMDNAEDVHDNTREAPTGDNAERNQRIGAMAAGGVAGGVAGGIQDSRSKSRSANPEESDGLIVEEEEDPKKKGRFGFVGSFASSLATAAKEQLASTILGDDLGEMLVEKQEESGDDNSDKEDEEDGKKKDDSKDKMADESKSKSKKKLFGRRR